MLKHISGDTGLLGLLGHGTNYSLSPAIHNCAINYLHLNQVYVNFQIAEDKVADFFSVLWHLGTIGFNVTKPYKNLAATLCEHPALPSINTVSRTSTGWKGHSTDGPGFVRSLQRIHGESEVIEHLVFFGTGGAAQSIAHHFSQNFLNLKSWGFFWGIKKNDHAIKSFVRRDIKTFFADWNSTDFTDLLNDVNSPNTLMIQAASAPANGSDMREFIAPFASFVGIFVDLIYDHPSALYFDAMNRGLKCQDGLAMLIEQARLSQEIWWGRSAPYNELARAIKNTGQLFGKSSTE